jgi:hypothetical protein
MQLEGNAASAKKRFYNRVRRTCLLHNIDIEYDGVPKMYAGVELKIDGDIIYGQYADDCKPLNINWQSVHECLLEFGFTGGVK